MRKALGNIKYNKSHHLVLKTSFLDVMKGLKRSGVKVEIGTKDKLRRMNSQLSDLFSVIELGEITGGIRYQFFLYI